MNEIIGYMFSSVAQSEKMMKQMRREMNYMHSRTTRASVKVTLVGIAVGLYVIPKLRHSASEIKKLQNEIGNISEELLSLKLKDSQRE